MYRTVTLLFMLALAVVLPIWPHSREWGFQPALTIAAIFAMLFVLRKMKLI